MKSRIIIKVMLATLMVLAAIMAWISGFIFGQEKGFKDGKQEGFEAGRLHQILEQCKDLLDKKLKDKETEKKEEQETTEN